MSETCAWANDFWFETLGFPVLRVSKAAANHASRWISKKQGMRLLGVKEKDYVCRRLPSEVWEMTAEEWRAWKLRAGRLAIAFLGLVKSKATTASWIFPREKSTRHATW